MNERGYWRTDYLTGEPIEFIADNRTVHELTIETAWYRGYDDGQENRPYRNPYKRKDYALAYIEGYWFYVVWDTDGQTDDIRIDDIPF